jgi:hypothetical protein
VRAWLLPSGAVLCVDDSFVDCTGFAPADVIGRPLAELSTDKPQFEA